MRSFLGRVVIGVLLVLLGARTPSAASGQCTSFGGCSGPGVQIMRASVVNDQLQLEVVQMVCEYVTKQVTIQVEDHQETKTVQECVMRPMVVMQSWSLGDVKLYRGDRQRVRSGRVAEDLAEPQYVLVCQPGQKLAKEWADLLRPETLVVFLTQPQIVAAAALAPVEVAPQPPVESAPAPVAPAPVESAPPLPSSEPAPSLPGDTAPLGDPPVIPPALLTAKVADGQFVVRSVAQYEFSQTVRITETDDQGEVAARDVALTTLNKQETLASVPVDAVQGWQADGTQLDADDLVSRLESYSGVLGIESAEPPSDEFLQLFQDDVLIIRTPSAAPPVAMPPAPAPAPFHGEA